MFYMEFVMASIDPFAQDQLNEIFKFKDSNSERLASRESSWLEFKESFGWTSLPKYIRTIAAFANASGGYIVFGVKNKPHIPVGLNEQSYQVFEGLDPARLTEQLNKYLAPEVRWDSFEYRFQNKVFGLWYIHEANDKPIICTKNLEKCMNESDIFYRYRGQTARIKYPELKAIIDDKQNTERKSWFSLIQKVARIGVGDAAVLNLQSGELSGRSGAVYIDEALLSQISFIKEGEFSEIVGKPTLKLIGELQSTSSPALLIGKTKAIKQKGIHLNDIIIAVLEEEKIKYPVDYIQQICYESTGFLPVYYFIQLAGISVEQTIDNVRKVVTRKYAKIKLLERLEKKKTEYTPISSSASESSVRKRNFTEAIKKHSVDNKIHGTDLKYCLQAVRGLQPEEVRTHSKYIRNLLKIWFNMHYTSPDSQIPDLLRRAICWIDEALHTKVDV